MYLDKPLRRHTLFQALTRTNRRWTNPATGQEKTDGLIVDYIGLGKEIAASMRIEKQEGEPSLSISTPSRPSSRPSSSRASSALKAST